MSACKPNSLVEPKEKFQVRNSVDEYNVESCVFDFTGQYVYVPVITNKEITKIETQAYSSNVVPINIESTNKINWKFVLNETQDKLN